MFSECVLVIDQVRYCYRLGALLFHCLLRHYSCPFVVVSSQRFGPAFRTVSYQRACISYLHFVPAYMHVAPAYCTCVLFMYFVRAVLAYILYMHPVYTHTYTFLTRLPYMSFSFISPSRHFMHYKFTQLLSIKHGLLLCANRIYFGNLQDFCDYMHCYMAIILTQLLSNSDTILK